MSFFASQWLYLFELDFIWFKNLPANFIIQPLTIDNWPLTGMLHAYFSRATSPLLSYILYCFRPEHDLLEQFRMNLEIQIWQFLEQVGQIPVSCTATGIQSHPTRKPWCKGRFPAVPFTIWLQYSRARWCFMRWISPKTKPPPKMSNTNASKKTTRCAP